MKCPFKKRFYVRNAALKTGGHSGDYDITEDFQNCIEEECAMWNRSEKICGLPIIPSVPKISDDYEPGAGGFSLM